MYLRAARADALDRAVMAYRLAKGCAPVELRKISHNADVMNYVGIAAGCAAAARDDRRVDEFTCWARQVSAWVYGAGAYITSSDLQRPWVLELWLNGEDPAMAANELVERFREQNDSEESEATDAD